jgi:hypothetical protein
VGAQSVDRGRQRRQRDRALDRPPAALGDLGQPDRGLVDDPVVDRAQVDLDPARADRPKLDRSGAPAAGPGREADALDPAQVG